MNGADAPSRNGSESGPSDGELARALESYLSAVEAGRPVDPDRLAAEHPAIAEELRSCLEVLRLAGKVEGEPGADGSDEGRPVDPDRMLGDFRMIRPVGRGGMGVVYEAEQVSLHRRVALKVLPFASALDPLQLRRFQTEALAAAQLHHTNIVPVFSVGCERGVHFYAMQYIEGQTLAALVRDLRRLAGLEPPAGEASTAGPSLAEEVASGRLAPASPADDALRRDRPPLESRLQAVRGGIPPEGGTPAGPGADSVGVPASAGPDERIPPEGGTPAGTVGAAPTDRMDSGSPGPARRPPDGLQTRADTTRTRGYFRTVANLGMQAAEALEHAHSLGIVHRDIKPANLLVDARGNLWITDFGLARIQADAGLTMTGDVIGTLRYMSPEQAMGKRAIIDHRSDIYSLGMALYELLALRPAITGEVREELLRQIALEEPRPPRRLNPSVPIDLETIVLKAMAKEPAERYATARELADDLRRFLEVKPIKARRPTVWDRALKLGRRHAGLVATALLVLLLAVGGLITSLILIGRERDATRAALARAIDQEKIARSNAEEAITQTRLAHDSNDWFLQGLTEPLKRMANPDLARNPDYAAMRLGVITEAIRGYEMSLRVRTDPPPEASDLIATHLHIALLHTVADDHAKAQDAYRRAIAIAEARNGEKPGAWNWYSVGQTHSHLAMELWDVGKRAESEPHFRRAVEGFRRAAELEPANPHFLQSSAWFLSLFQDERFRDPPRAIEDARRLVAVTSEREDNRRSYSFGRRPLFTLGLAEYRMANLGAARSALERSIELREGGDAYEWFVLAMVVARQGNLERARELHSKAVRWTRMYRYSDFELHALDAESAEFLRPLEQPMGRADRPMTPGVEAGDAASRP